MKKTLYNGTGTKILLFLIVIIMAISNVSAFEFDNTKSYDANTKTVTITNAFGLGEEVAKAQLITPQINYVIAGKNRKVAEFNINLNDDSYSDALKLIELTNNKDGKAITRDINYKYKTLIPYDVEVNDYEEVCIEGEEINKTTGRLELICENRITGTHRETRYNELWTPLNKLDLTKGNITIGLFVDVLPNDNVEWIPTLFGVRINEWATWTASFNIGLTAYYNLEAGVTTSTSPELIKGIYNMTTLTNPIAFNSTNCRIGNCLQVADVTSEWRIPANSQIDFGNSNNESSFNWWGFSTISSDSCILRWYNPSGCWSAQSGAWLVQGTGWSATNNLQSFNFDVTNYHMMTWTRNNTGAYIYQNGTRLVGPVSSTNTGTSNLDSVSGGWGMKGQLDEVGFWNRTLTPTEIVDLYNDGAGMTYDANPISSADLYPTFTTLTETPSNNTQYVKDAVYDFAITILDTNGSAGIEWNGVNYTAMNTSFNINIYNKTFTDLGAGVNNYYIWGYGNGTSHFFNRTQDYSYTVNKSTVTFSTSVTTPIYQTTASNYVGSISPIADNSCSLLLQRNDVNIDNGYSVTDTSVLAIGTYIYNYTIFGASAGACSNFTTSSELKTLEVLKNTPQINYVSPINFLNTSSKNITITVSISGTNITNATFYLYNSAHNLINTSVVNVGLSEGLIHYYALEENTGANALDSIAGKTNGTVLSGGTWTQGKLGYGLNVTSDDGAINLSRITGTSENMTFSLALWFWDDHVQADHEFIYLDATHGDKIFAQTFGGYRFVTENEYSGIFDYAQYKQSKWVFQVYIRNETGYYMYENGTYLAPNGGTATRSSGTFNDFYIGKYYDTGTDSMRGIIDEIGIWNRSLTTDEIIAMYNNGVGETYPISSIVYSVTYTNLADGTYYHNVTANNIFNNENSTETRTFLIDTIIPQISFNATNPVNNSYTDKNWFTITLDWVETNFQKVTYFLYNSARVLVDSFVNTDATNKSHTFTGLTDDNYYYNATIEDIAGNTNSTDTREITIDTTYPIINFTSNTPINNSMQNFNWVFIEVNVTELNLINVTFAFGNRSAIGTNTSATYYYYNFTSISDGLYYYNVTAIDLSGNSNMTETREITLDATIPNIIINSPLTTIIYGYNGKNETLNTTITDASNLSFCWFNYALTNYTLNCTSGLNSFLLNNTYSNLTVYANDTFNNIAKIKRDFGYTIFENAISNVTIINSGSSATFFYNMTYNPTYTASTVNLIYNGTTYTMVTTDLSTTKYYSISPVLLSETSGTVNKSYYYSIILSNVSNTDTFNSRIFNQTINALFIDNCSNYTTKILNFTMFDEDNLTAMSGTIEVALSIYAYGTKTLVSTYNTSMNYVPGTPSSVCINIGNQSYSIDYEIKNYGDPTIYYKKYRNIQNMTISNATANQNIALYNMLISRAYVFGINVVGSYTTPNGNTGLLVDILRKYVPQNKYTSIESVISDATGKGVGHLIAGNEIYSFIVSYQGRVLGYFNEYEVQCQNPSIGQCFITLNLGQSTGEIINYNNYGNITTLYTLNNDSTILTMTFSSTDGKAHLVNLTLLKADGYLNETICQTSAYGTSGALQCIIPAVWQNTSFATQLSVDYVYIATKLFSAGVQPSFYGVEIFIQLLMFSSLVLLMIGNPIMIVVGAIFGMLMSGILLFIGTNNFISMMAAVLFYVIGGIIIIWQIGRKM